MNFLRGKTKERKRKPFHNSIPSEHKNENFKLNNDILWLQFFIVYLIKTDIIISIKRIKYINIF